LVPYKEMTRVRRSWPWWRWVLTGLSSLALVLSAYLSWHYLVGGAVIGCGGGSPCDQVLSSRWATIGGVLPVSGLAAGAYLAMLVASLSIGPASAVPVRRLAWGAILVLVGAAAGSAVWFIILQKWVIGAFCPYCMTTHISGLLLAALVIWRAPKQFDNDSTDVAMRNPVSNTPVNAGVTSPAQDISPVIPHRVIGSLPSVGLALAGILAACQIGFPPRAVYRDGNAQDNLPVIDPHAVPLVGLPDAVSVVTLLFDYTCSHCQKIHFMLDEAIRRYDGKLAFALCPTPLNSQCNPYIPRDMDAFKDSCELAKIGLAVWVANREAFSAFDRWMFSLESGDRWRPRSIDAARAKAVEWVGQAKFDAARSDPWIDRYLQTSIQLYGDTGGNAIPKLVFGSRWVVPEPYDADDLVLILQDSLAVPTERKKVVSTMSKADSLGTYFTQTYPPYSASVPILNGK
jgi:uncharacterized membrane protein/protein-disulfide isomerase